MKKSGSLSLQMGQKKLPVDVSNFPTMIEDGYLYIDKTQIIHHLITKRRLYFLSRPRRFGKSLLISTLKELFSGNKKLFKDLWIGKHSDYVWIEYPVLDFDFSNLSFNTAQEFEISFSEALDDLAQIYTIDLTGKKLLGSKLKKLIIELAKKNKIVVLIDEYDAPLLANLNNLNSATSIQKVMKNIFNILKSMDGKGYIKAMFVTGVTKFSKTTLFSGFNNLNDMTLEPETATLLGYTKDELLKNFNKHAKEFAQNNNITIQETFNTIQEFYNGYRFSRDENTVFNPYSVLNCFDKNNISNYWLNTGTPGFLIELLKKQYDNIQKLETYEVDEAFLGTFEIGELPIIPILFQAGYLTIDTYNKIEQTYTLKFPNREVRDAFEKYILAALVDSSARDITQQISQFKQALEANDIEDFCSMLKSMLAGIPSYLHIKQEAYYHSLFHIIINLLGFKGESEVITDKGRIDIVIDTKSRIFIFEFKLNSRAKYALNQILNRQYHEKYKRFKKPISLVGLSFNVKTKTLLFDWLKKDLKKKIA